MKNLKDIGYPHYAATVDGRIYSLYSKKFLSENKKLGDYKAVTLCEDGERKEETVHRLIAKAFVPNPNNLPIVNHIDGNKSNNHYTNLEWTNIRENNCHRFINKNKSSKYIGVSYIKAKKKFVATINFNGISKTLGHFDNEEDAYELRSKFERDNDIANKYL